ncbi:MAG: transposase [Kurthia sp.]|nr:transposase [Candidatus Kurthia equi]
MNFNMELIGFTDVIITKIEKIGGQIALYLEVPKKAHICPSCLNTTTKIHDYRIQKIKHLNKEEDKQ